MLERQRAAQVARQPAAERQPEAEAADRLVAVVVAALERLYNASRGWMDAYAGRPVESAI